MKLSWERIVTRLMRERRNGDKDLNDLFLDTLKDIYFAEKQIYKNLPKMAKAAASDQLRGGL